MSMRLCAVSILALSTVGCNLTGPSQTVDGQWLTNAGGRFDFAIMRLEQNGDDITGTACAVGGGTQLYRDAPVRGNHPHLQFDTPGGVRFSGRQESSGDIIGTYGTMDVRFKRDDRNFCP